MLHLVLQMARHLGAAFGAEGWTWTTNQKFPNRKLPA